MTDSWHILGAGAIGSLMACKLERAGIRSCLLHRQDNRPQASSIELIEGDSSSQVAVTYRHTAELASGAVSQLLITTKAHQALPAFEQVRPYLQPGATIVLLHNGMGVYEQICAQWDGERIFCATTTEGAYLQGHNQLVYAGQGDTRVGQPQLQQPPGWFAPLASCGERFSWSAEIDAELWRKLLINCAINPLTAIHRCRNGELLENPQWQAQAQQVCQELSAVALAAGHPQLAEKIAAQAFAVMRSTASNQSSMLQDVLQGRGTEIEYISGYLCEQARRLQVPCPANQELLAQLRELDSANSGT